jgi:hypothetical protein
MTELAVVAPAFVKTAHRIGGATGATVAAGGGPRSRVRHPIWEWDGATHTGWIASCPRTAKARHHDDDARISLT